MTHFPKSAFSNALKSSPLAVWKSVAEDLASLYCRNFGLRHNLVLNFGLNRFGTDEGRGVNLFDSTKEIHRRKKADLHKREAAPRS